MNFHAVVQVIRREAVRSAPDIAVRTCSYEHHGHKFGIDPNTRGGLRQAADTVLVPVIVPCQRLLVRKRLVLQSCKTTDRTRLEELCQGIAGQLLARPRDTGLMGVIQEYMLSAAVTERTFPLMTPRQTMTISPVTLTDGELILTT